MRTIAPPRPPVESTWREHDGHAENWTWQINPGGADRAICPEHNAIFDLPEVGEVMAA